MKLMTLRLTAVMVTALGLAQCGSSSSGSTVVDASTDSSVDNDATSPEDSSTGEDGSSPGDASATPEASVDDSGGGGDGEAGTGTGDANQTPCDPNDSSTCAKGDKCCSEPTHMNPPSIYECVPPEANGACPMYP